MGRNKSRLVLKWASHWPADGDLNQWDTHVDAEVDLVSDRGSIPLTSTSDSQKHTTPRRLVDGALCVDLQPTTHDHDALGETMHAEEAISIRLSQASDAAAIARIHTDSWRRHYRGMYADRYLDGDLYAERLSVWTERMTQHAPDHFTLLAEHGSPVGFAHVALGADPVWGAMVENLHVTYSLQRSGVGSLLLERVANVIWERQPRSGIFLWVLEQNEAAIAFYESAGTLRDREPSSPPGKDPGIFTGTQCGFA